MLWFLETMHNERRRPFGRLAIPAKSSRQSGNDAQTCKYFQFSMAA